MHDGECDYWSIIALYPDGCDVHMFFYFPVDFFIVFSLKMSHTCVTGRILQGGREPSARVKAVPNAWLTLLLGGVGTA